MSTPSGYPEDFFEGATRWKYYNASVKAHNTLTFGDREQRFPTREPGKPILTKPISGQVEQWWHEPGQGPAWSMELAPAYSGVKHFKRTVLHLWPGYILVLDDAALAANESISLRWHTINKAEPTDDGSFVAHNDQAAAAGRIINLGSGELSIQRKEHRYEAPYNRDRTGDLLEVRNESFLNASLVGDRCRLLTLFATGAAADFGADATWQTTANDWTFDGPHGPITATVSDTHVSLRAPQLDREVTLSLS